MASAPRCFSPGAWSRSSAARLLRGARLVADGAEGIALAVVRPRAAERERLADLIERVEVLHDAAQVPFRIEVVRRRVVAVLGVVVQLRQAVFAALVDVVNA